MSDQAPETTAPPVEQATTEGQTQPPAVAVRPSEPPSVSTDAVPADGHPTDFMTPTTASHDHPDHPALNTVPSEPELAAESTAIDVTSDPIVSPSSPVPAVVLLLQSQLEDLQEKLGEEKDSNGRKQKQIEGLLQTANILQSQKEEELRKQIFQLHGTIGERERDRVRLQNEIDRRTAAIRGCGEEIGRLRSGVKEATEERNDLAERLKRIVESEKKEMGRIMELVKTADPAGPAPPSSLLHQMRILTTRYQQQSSDLREAQQNNDSLDSTINAQEEKIGQYNELQKVMAKQAKQLGKMDKLEGKLGAYKSTVAMQEKVIGKLENAIEVKIRQDAKKGPAAWAKQEVQASERAAELERTLAEEKERTEELEDKGKIMKEDYERVEGELQDALLRAATAERGLVLAQEEKDKVGAVDPEVTAKLSVAEMKVSILEEQLVDLSKEKQKEISALKIKVMEMEADDMEVLGGMSLGGLSGSSSLSSLARSLRP